MSRKYDYDLDHDFVFDLETDGLLDEVTIIHCAVAISVQTGECYDFGPDEIDEFIWLYLNSRGLWIGHNVIGYDTKVLEKLYGIRHVDQYNEHLKDPQILRERIVDTMVLGCVIHPDIKTTDFERNRRWKKYVAVTDAGETWKSDPPLEFPGQFIGHHSLAAWGYRLGLHKGDYKGGWAKWSTDMHEYMIQDGRVTEALYKAFLKHELDPLCWRLEHDCKWLCCQIEINGFPFDEKGAAKLLSGWVTEREKLREELKVLFPSWKVRLPDFVPKRDNKPKGYVKGVPVERWKEVEFNPQSRAHIIRCLKHKYGWKPHPDDYTQKPEVDPVTKEKIPKGSPKMDEDVLKSLPYPEAETLARLFLLNKRIGQLSEGNQAWLKVQKNGKIHARYNTNGAVTGRATHSRPNISQVPRVSSEYGRECRALFHVPDGWVLLGSDQAGLELRCLSSDLSHYDGGKYGEVVCDGDVHTVNQEAAGLPSRDTAKTFIYAFLYGAGVGEIGRIAGGSGALGSKLKKRFLAKIPGLEKLIGKVVGAAESRGWIKGIDGRKLPIRSSHAALNTRLQSTGAIICKQWGVDWEKALVAQGLKHGWDGDFAFLSWSHDEYQVAVRDDPEIIEKVRAAGIKAGRNAGKPFNFKCRLDVDVKVGRNWAETH